MGYKIKVNHSQFDKAADAIDCYTSKMNTKMNSADQNMKAMFASWNGVDSASFKAKWDTVNDADSTYGKMKKSLESYSKFLRSAGNKYKKAQADAINRANKLPKW